MRNEKRATANAMTPQPKGKDSDFRRYSQMLSEDIAKTLVHLKTGKKGGYRCTLPLKTAFTGYRDNSYVIAQQEAVNAKLEEARAAGYALNSKECKDLCDPAKGLQVLAYFQNSEMWTSGVEAVPNGVLYVDEDNQLTTPEMMVYKYGAFASAESVRGAGTQSLFSYDYPSVTHDEATTALKNFTGIKLDEGANKVKQGTFLSAKSYIWEDTTPRLFISRAFVDKFGDPEPPTPTRTRTTEPPKPRSKRGRPRRAEAKIRGWFAEREFHGFEPTERGEWDDTLRDVAEYCAGIGADKDEARELCRELFEFVPDGVFGEDEFESMFKRAYKDIATKEANKVAEERAKLRENIGAGSLIDVRGKDYYVARDGSISIRSPLWAKDYLGGKDLYSMRPSFEGFIHAPDNLNFSYVVDDLFNIAAQVPRYEPKGNPTPSIDALLAHIFGAWGDDDNGVQRGLDWVQIAYTNPAQKLPILVLTSIEQGTGKTSFLQFLKLLFGRAAVDADVSSVTGQFTSHWAHAQIVMIDEQATNSREQAGFLKKYSTAKTLRYEAKGAAAEFVDFFGKFVIANNHEERPVYLEEEDTRYVVLPVPSLVGNSDPEFMTRVEAEMGDFVAMLRDRELHTPKRGRLWFAPEDLETEATRKAKRSSRSTMHEALDAMLDSMSEQLPDEPLIFTSKTYRMYVERIEDLQWRQDSARIALERKGVQKRSQRHIVLSDWSIEEGEKWELRKADSIRCWLITRRSDR